MADAYLWHTVWDVPASVVFQPDGRLRAQAAHAVSIGVARIIAGPTHCHIKLDIRRPYFRPVAGPVIEGVAA